MGVCASCTERASTVVVPVFCGSSANGWAAIPRNRARSACCCIRFASVRHHCSGETGAAENIDAPVSNSCGTNASTCICCLLPLRHPPRTRSSPGRNVRTRASHGLSGLLAMRAQKLLDKSRSCCLASQQTLPPHSVSRQRNFAFPADRLPLLGQAGFSDQTLLVSFSAGSHFFLFSALLALHPTSLAVSDELPCSVLYDFRLRFND